jgi:hypothetical protein
MKTLSEEEKKREWPNKIFCLSSSHINQLNRMKHYIWSKHENG